MCTDGVRKEGYECFGRSEFSVIWRKWKIDLKSSIKTNYKCHN